MKQQSTDFYADMDLPPSDSDEEEREQVVREDKVFNVEQELSAKEIKKREAKARAEKEAAERQRAQLMRDDDSAYTVTIGSSLDSVDPNSRDIKVDGFSVSARGKVLLQNANLSIVHGRRYGLAGPNGTGKTTLLKLIAKRLIHVPDHIDVLIVEQEVVGDDRTALQVQRVCLDLSLSAEFTYLLVLCSLGRS